ncbi:hypothetical protein GCM10023189_43040 [Nibrella saemangeumensis]|uniref:Uncharacterized protein n=1 Tax=Nibrella saemangeumensis TaxID=1084526 RepID=A0ABP8NDL0_9BACT
METCSNWSEEKKQRFNPHELHEARYIFAQAKALIRMQDNGSPFLELCLEDERNWQDDVGQIYHEYILILHAFNEHLEAFID